MFQKDKIVLIGKVAATHGVRGQLRVVPFSGDADSFLSYRTLIFKDPAGCFESFEVSHSSVHGKKVLLALKPYDDINKVERLVGREIYIERGQMPELPEGEYYWCDLIGLKVQTTQGEYLGELFDILATGGNDVYLVRNGEREYLIPAVDDVVTDINIADGVMQVDPPPGLLEL